MGPQFDAYRKSVTVLWKLALNLRWFDKLIWERPLDGYLGQFQWEVSCPVSDMTPRMKHDEIEFLNAQFHFTVSYASFII